MSEEKRAEYLARIRPGQQASAAVLAMLEAEVTLR